MRFTKPAWLNHADEKRDHEVYSCHVSPDSTRLATGGGDSKVRIWSTEAILHASNPDYTQPRQLASLSIHSGTVHSVSTDTIVSTAGLWSAGDVGGASAARIVCGSSAPHPRTTSVPSDS